MCDTRTWVFKLLIVFIIIHFSRIQRCHGVNAATWTTAGAGGSSSSTGLDAAIARGPVIDTADISIDNDDNDNNNDDDDSFEVVTSPPEDSLGRISQRSQRTNFNSTFNSRRQQLVRSSLSSNANRLPSDEVADVVDADDDGSNEEFITNQRKFNNEGTASAIQRKELAVESSKRSSILNILQGVDYIGDTITASSTSPQSSSSASPPPPQQSQVGWDGNAAIIVDEDDEDVDEILQPMMVMASDKHHYHSNNGGRVMSQAPEAAQPGAGYPIEYNPNRNEESSGSSNPRKEAPPVTNRAKSESRISAFEQHKAIIRNNRRYGHKTHKKKYKDYLRYSPLTTTTTTTPSPTTSTTMSSLRKGFLARDRIFNSEDLPSRKFYEGRINYFSNNDDDDDDNDEDTDPKRDQNFRSYHNPIRQHHNTHHLRNGGGRYRHVGATAPKTNRPHSPVYSDYNGLNIHHLGSRAMQKHQKELEKKIEEYSQYYAKWPHLAQVEDQLFEDEHTDLLYPEAGGSSPGELVLSSNDDEDNQNSKKEEEDEEDANLPPYIKKYRRRNKQLMDLLEGTKPPPSTQAPQWSSSVLKPGPIDGSHHHQHRKHHNHRQHRNHHRHKNSKWQIEDLFEEQRANPNNPNKTTIYSEIVKPTPSVVDTSSKSTTATTTTTMTTTSTPSPSTTTLSPFEELLKHENEHLKLLQENKLPAEDVSISRELYDWAIDTSDDQSHQDDFNEDDDEDYIDLNHNQQTQHRWKSSNRNASPIKYPTTTTTRRPITSMRRPNAVYGSIIRSPPTTTARPMNSFVYHRVVESPRAVGAGQTGRKQRLPFVAITDRRLETSRKGMGNAGVLARKDFEQNHFPMP